MWESLGCLFLVPVVVAIIIYGIGLVIDKFRRDDDGEPPVRMA
jgi:TRAP-type mannitol/chloroaromatic compound transport system permease small subunit